MILDKNGRVMPGSKIGPINALDPAAAKKVEQMKDDLLKIAIIRLGGSQIFRSHEIEAASAQIDLEMSVSQSGADLQIETYLKSPRKMVADPKAMEEKQLRAALFQSHKIAAALLFALNGRSIDGDLTFIIDENLLNETDGLQLKFEPAPDGSGNLMLRLSRASNDERQP